MTNIPPVSDKKRLDELAQRDAHHTQDRVNEFHRSLNEAAIKGAETALRSALLINGGAAVSVLAFIVGLPRRAGLSLINFTQWLTAWLYLPLALSLQS
jgi:hypothetical protein